jgi:hypothetical protein
MAQWQRGNVDKMAQWKNDTMAKRQTGRVSNWQTGNFAAKLVDLNVAAMWLGGREIQMMPLAFECVLLKPAPSAVF